MWRCGQRMSVRTRWKGRLRADIPKRLALGTGGPRECCSRIPCRKTSSSRKLDALRSPPAALPGTF